jgi:putative membrane protein
MTGLMVGSLRALWPWQSDAGELLLPTNGFLVEVAMLTVGGLVVSGLIYAERKITKP